jgi:hypothetical protein
MRGLTKPQAHGCRDHRPGVTPGDGIGYLDHRHSGAVIAAIQRVDRMRELSRRQPCADSLSAGGMRMNEVVAVGALRRWIAAPAVVVLVATCTACGHQKARAAASGPSLASSPTATASPAALPSSQASALTVALTATDPAVVEPALAPAVRSGYASTPFQLLPAGTSVAIDASKMIVTGELATVPAIVTGGPAAGPWTLLLQNVDGQWLLYGTRKG